MNANIENSNQPIQSDPGLPGGQPSISVIDAVPAVGFNPIWEQIQIAFTPGNTPRQLFSDNEIADAFAGRIESKTEIERH